MVSFQVVLKKSRVYDYNYNEKSFESPPDVFIHLELEEASSALQLFNVIRWCFDKDTGA